MYPAPIMPILILLIRLFLLQNCCGRDARIARKFKRISFPVLRTKDLNTRNFVVTDAPERGQHFVQRQNAETRKQPVLIFQLAARTDLRRR